MLITIILFICGALTPLLGQQYLWPTNASPYVSSSFCEYRATHFHAAIDIKTWNQVGYPCYAAADGVIERVRVSPFGYGKVIYLKMTDGKTAVYAHLQKFSPALDDLVRRRQFHEKRYTVDLWPNMVVKRGDIIAYTGETGVGVPHLHFEIRDERNRPLNPLQFYPDVGDNRRPVLQELLLSPQDENSSVNGSFLPYIVEVQHTGNGVYRPVTPISAYGRVGLAIRGYDLADDVSNQLAFYQTDLLVNGRVVHGRRYDRVDFGNSYMVNIEYDYPARVNWGKRFLKLFTEPFNTLSFYNQSPGAGIIVVDKEPLNFEIITADFFGNNSRVEGVIQPESRETVRLQQASLLGDKAYLNLQLPAGIQNIEFFSGKSKDRLNTVEYFEFIDDRAVKGNGETDQEKLVKLKLRQPDDHIIKSVVVTRLGEMKESFAYLSATENAAPVMTYRLLGKYLYVSFDSLPVMANLTLHAGDEPIGDWRFSAPGAEYVYPAKRLSANPLRLQLRSSGVVFLDTVLAIHKALPGKQERFRFFNDSLMIKIEANSLYDTLLFQVKKQPIATVGSSLLLAEESWQIEPADQIFNNTVQLSLKIPDAFVYDKRVAVYSLNGDKISYAGGQNEGGYLHLRARTFGAYTIAVDTIPPQLTLQHPLPSRRYNKPPSIRFGIKDDESGIGSDENIEIYLNGQWVIPEWDPEENVVDGYPPQTPQKGANSLLIRVKDRAGNVVERSFQFSVTDP